MKFVFTLGTTVLLSALLMGKSVAQTNTFPSTGTAGIGTITPDASSLLEIKSTSKGLLIPRMTKIKRDAIVAPATGLLIYQTNSAPGFYYYSGTAWTAVTAKNHGWSLTGNAGTIAGTNFIGTTDAQPLIFKTNNTKAGIIDFDELKANTGFGYLSLFSNGSGAYNTAVGFQALYSNSIGSLNTANGLNALYYNTEGNNNTANGLYALLSNTTGSYNTGLGYSANVSAGDLSFATVIGTGAVVDASSKVRIGNASITSIGGEVGWSTFSDGRYKKNIKEDVQGLRFINSLKPITYTVEIDKLNDYYDKSRRPDDSDEKMKKDMQPYADEAAKIVYNGFIAQDVEAAAKKLNYDFSGVDKPKTKDGLYSLRYADFVVPLVKAVQELSKMNGAKDAKINDLQKQNDMQQRQIDELRTMMQSLQQNFNSGGQSALSNELLVMSSASLAQNIPNPFNHTTTINYSLPQQYSSAKIIVVDKSGKVLKEINISGAGKGSTTIDASTLAAGAYNYSLMIDGKLIVTKQMVLTH